jgi:hypothetical protein
MPMSMIVACSPSAAGWLADRKEWRFGPRQGLILILLRLLRPDHLNADFPVEAAGEMGLGVEGAWSSRSSFPSHCAPAADRGGPAVPDCLSAAAIIIVGGIKTVLSAAATACST